MDLRTRAIKSTAWYATTRASTQALSWAVTIVLARLLVPSDYGLFGMAFGVVSFLELFQQLGIGAALIQRPTIDRVQLNTIFWGVVGASVLVAGVTFAVAGGVATFYADERLVGIVRSLGLILIFNGIGTVPYSLLTRDIDFRRRSLGESAGVLAGTATSVALAWGGHGVWALVAGELVRSGVRNAAMVAFCGWRPGVEVSRSGLREIVGFGLNVAGATFVREVSSLVNTAILGRLLGGHMLGLYSMAQSISTNPFHKLTTAVINQLSLPVFSRLQADVEQLRRYYLKVTRYLAVLSLPMQAGMALVAADLVTVLLSDKWHSIIPLFQIMCIGGIWFALPLPAPPILTARGRVRLTLQLAMLSSVVMAVALSIGARFQLAGVATAWVLSYCSMRSLLVIAALREIELPARAYLGTLVGPLVSVVVMIAAVLGMRAVAPDLAAPVVRLGRDVAVGMIAYAGMLVLVDRALLAELGSIAQAMFSAEPASPRERA